MRISSVAMHCLIAWGILITLGGGCSRSQELAVVTPLHPYVEDLVSSERQTREAGKDGLVEMGAEAVPLLVSALADGRAEMVWAVRETLEQIGPVAIDHLAILLHDGTKPWPQRWSAVRVLSGIGVQAPELVLPVLIHALGDHVPNIAGSAATAIGRLGSAAEIAVEALVEVALFSRHAYVRAQAVDALANIGMNADPVIAAIGLALGDEDLTVAMAGNRALRSIGAGREKVAPVLLRMLREEEANSTKIMSALGRIGAVSIEPLMAMAEGEDVAARSLIAVVLGQIMPGGISGLIQLTMDEAPGVRLAAAASLGRASTRGEEIYETLARLAKDETEEERIRVVASRSVLALTAAGVVERKETKEADLIERLGSERVEYFVAQNGNDAWSGMLPQPNADGTDGPFKSLARVVQILMPGDTCTIREGIYREPLRPTHSGEAERPIVFRSYPGEEVLLSGADAVTGWEHDQGSIFRAPMHANLGDMNQVFVDGKLMLEARWPNSFGDILQPNQATLTAVDGYRVSDRRLPRFSDPGFWQGAYFWSAGGVAWSTWAVDIDDFDARTRTFTLNRAQLDSAIGYSHEHYFPRPGNEYIIMGTKGLLDAEGEWWYDDEEGYLYLWAPGGVDPNTVHVEARARLNMVDLSGVEHIHIDGINLRASGLITDDNTRHVVLTNMTARYIGHSYRRDVTGRAAIVLAGQYNEIRNCEFAYSSGTILMVRGSDHKVINSYVHHGNYNASFAGMVRVAGHRHLISHNTFRHAGRDVMNIGGISESIIQYNVLSDAGWLTHDLGMTYGHTNDFQNTVIRYNWVHDNRAGRTAMGIYFDHVSRNVIVHNNVIWNVSRDPLRVNNPGYFVLFFNNTTYNTGTMGTFDWGRRNDLFGTIVANNLLTGAPDLPRNVVENSNLVSRGDLTDPQQQDFRLRSGSDAIDAGHLIFGVTDQYTGAAPDMGAYPFGIEPWIPGHDFSAAPDPVFERPQVEYMNLVRNACFDDGNLDYWQSIGEGSAGVTPGNQWGREPLAATGTGRYELRLGGESAGVEQEITGLEPNTDYRFSAWVRVADTDNSVAVGVRSSERVMEEIRSESSTWVHQIVSFRTGSDQERVVVYIQKAAGSGRAFAANVGLQKQFGQ